MADTEKDSFDELLGIWQQGQEMFFKAQGEAVESFAKSFSDMAQSEKTESDYDPVEAWSNFIKSWAPDWDANQYIAGVQSFDKSSNPFFAMLEPANWTQYAPEQLRIILQSIAEGPRFADLATPQYEAAEAWRETLDYNKASADMAKVMHDAWRRAYAIYGEKYSLEDLQSGQVQEALNAWLEAANSELLEVQRSEQYLDAQKRMIRSSTEIRARQKDIAESWSEQWQMPTRTEIDDLSKTVYALRREIRMLKREVAALKENQK